LLAGVALLALGGVTVFALRAGLGQPAARADASAQAAAQAAVSQIESCYATRHDYRQCAAPALLSSAGLTVGESGGEVRAWASDPTSYTVVARSTAVAAAGHGPVAFTVVKDSVGMTRICNAPGVGGCSVAGRW
jgi:hypothetical protein